MKKSGSVVRALTGVLIVVAAVTMLLNNIGLVDVDTMVKTWWPLAIVLAGGLVFANNTRSWIVASFLVALGGLYQLKILEIVDFTPWMVIWPLVLLLIGLSLLFRGSSMSDTSSTAEKEDVTAILAGSTATSTSKKFSRADLTAIMGGAKLDLREANIQDGATLNVFGFWGGVEIILPTNVVVRNQLNNVLGGTEDKTKQVAPAKAPTLTIRGDVIMAGVSIRNRPSED